MPGQNRACSNTKDKRVLVLFALGAGILAGSWLPQSMYGQPGSYFWKDLAVDSSPRVIRTTQGSRPKDDFSAEISRHTNCAQTPPRLALFFGLPVPVNRADKLTLTMLPGIGEKRAESILRFRAEQGGITNREMLARVGGISRKLADRLGPMLCYD
jgi:hypothetical protein